MDIDVNDVLAAFAAENAKQTQRAIIAETQNTALQKAVLNQHEIIARLEAQIEASADQPADEAVAEPGEPHAQAGEAAPKRRRGSSPTA